MNRENVISVLNSLKKELGIDYEIKLELRPMKVKAASISLSKGIIRLNKNILSHLSIDSIRYLLLHELIHYKLKSVYHNREFYECLGQITDKGEISRLESEIINALLKINKMSRKKFQW